MKRSRSCRRTNKLRLSSRKSKRKMIREYKCKYPLPDGSEFTAHIYPGISSNPLSLAFTLTSLTKKFCNAANSFPNGKFAIQSLRNMQVEPDSTHDIIITYINSQISGFGVILNSKFKSPLTDIPNSSVCRPNELYIDSFCSHSSRNSRVNVQLAMKCIRRFAKSKKKNQLVTHSPNKRDMNLLMDSLEFSRCPNACRGCKQTTDSFLSRDRRRGPRRTMCVS